MHIDYRLYGAAGMTPAVPADGEGISLIALDVAFRDFPDAAWLRQQLPKARIAFASNSREAQAKMCAAGVGLAVLPAPLGDSIRGLQAVDLGTAPPGRDVWLGFHRDLRRLARLRSLVDVTVERLAG
jgi:DNA-binding transcriptional LysR family regulator